MPVKFESGTMFIEGRPVYGIAEFTCDMGTVVKEYFDANSIITWTTPLSYEFYIKWNNYLLYKLMGLWNWVADNCPNRRVAHLIKYGKTERVRNKNFKRGLHILGTYLDATESSTIMQ